MADRNNSEASAAMTMGIVFAIIGALVGSQANGGGALAGAVAGFALGIAFIKFIKWAAIFVVAGIGLFLAYMSLNAASDRLKSVSGGSGGAPTVDSGVTLDPPSDIPGPDDTGADTGNSAGASAYPDITTEADRIRFRNECDRNVILYVKWEQPSRGFIVHGPWAVGPSKQTFLSFEDGTDIQAASSNIYYYAYIPNGNYDWHGAHDERFNGLSLPMRVERLTKAKTYEFVIDCNTLHGLPPTLGSSGSILSTER